MKKKGMSVDAVKEIILWIIFAVLALLGVLLLKRLMT